MALTRNLKLRLSDELTSDARYNLERIDQLGTIFPITNTSSQTVNSSGDIRLNANATIFGGDGDGKVFAPNLQTSSITLETGLYTLNLKASTQTTNLAFTLPPNYGTSGQFLRTNGLGTLAWGDPPTSNFNTLNDTTFIDLLPGQVAQYDGSAWVNVSLSSTRQTNTFVWEPSDGATKTITHEFNSDKVQCWIYDTEDKKEVRVEGLDYFDLDTIILTAHIAPKQNYIVHLIQTI